MASKRYVLTLKAANDLREARAWSHARWGKSLTHRYFEDLHVDFERWRIALQEDGRGSVVVTRRIRQLERELARKEKALAEAAPAALDEDDDADGPSGI